VLSLPQPVRFALVGVANTALDWLVFFLGVTLWPSADATLLKAASFGVGVLNSFVCNSLWTFRAQFLAIGSGRAVLRPFVRFLAVSLAMLALNALGFALIARGLHLGQFAGLVGATLIAFACGYWLNRVWTYA
jgi:putative flippase GtrA